MSFLNVSVNEPPGFCLIAVSSMPSEIWPASRFASSHGTWSLPPWTWYFSFEGPNVWNWPWPE